MTSKTTSSPKEAYVWIWLPGEVEPVVAGLLSQSIDGSNVSLDFNYGQSYLKRKNAISIYTPELPLREGIIAPAGSLAGCLRDGAPDAWGRRVIINKITGKKGEDAAAVELSELTFMLESGSDRIGALDFQISPVKYVPRVAGNATLERLMTSAEMIEQGIELPIELRQAIQHGSSIGGARPKALIEGDAHKYVAKFSSTNDLYSVVKAEFIAMRLTQLAGLDVAHVELKNVAGKDVILIERFDRTRTEKGWTRRAMVSALTILGLDEMASRYASYEDLAQTIRLHFIKPKETLRELYSRMTFNILVGNTDDHARNHAAFWDGSQLELTPAYDICPQSRVGGEATQSMSIYGQDKFSRIQLCLKACNQFMLSLQDAISIVEYQIKVIADRWNEVCSEANINAVDKELFMGRQFLNPYAFYGLPDEASHLQQIAGACLNRNG